MGQKYTLYRVSESMAMTVKTEITIKDVEEKRIVFTKSKGRKRFELSFESRHYQSAPLLPLKAAIFEGWNQPIKCDTEQSQGVMRGNACLNFLGSVDDVRAWIEQYQLNPFFEKYRVVAIGKAESTFGDAPETVVFPEEYKGGHAIIDQILAKSD